MTALLGEATGWSAEMTTLPAHFAILDAEATAPNDEPTATTASPGWTEHRCHRTGR